MTNPLTVAKSALDVVKQVHDAHLQIELTQKILELQAMVSERDETIREQREQIQILTAKLTDKTAIERFIASAQRRDNAFWVDDVAYCIRCAEAGLKRSLTPASYGNGICPECKNEYCGVYPLPTGSLI